MVHRKYPQSSALPGSVWEPSLRPPPLTSNAAMRPTAIRSHDFEKDERARTSRFGLSVERVCDRTFRQPSGTGPDRKRPSRQLPRRSCLELPGRTEILSPVKDQATSILRFPWVLDRHTFYQALAYFASGKIYFFPPLAYRLFIGFASYPHWARRWTFRIFTSPKSANTDFRRPTQLRGSVMSFLPKRPTIESHLADIRRSSMTLSGHPRRFPTLKLDSFRRSGKELRHGSHAPSSCHIGPRDRATEGGGRDCSSSSSTSIEDAFWLEGRPLFANFLSSGRETGAPRCGGSGAAMLREGVCLPRHPGDNGKVPSPRPTAVRTDAL